MTGSVLPSVSSASVSQNGIREFIAEQYIPNPNFQPFNDGSRYANRISRSAAPDRLRFGTAETATLLE
jgi:hypothetical protein